MIVLAHVSDLHLDGSERNHARAVQVMRYFARLTRQPDAIVVTGDLSDHGISDEYEEVRQVLSAPIPVLTCPGNHDIRAAYRSVLLDETGTDVPINHVHRVAGAVIAMCDSIIPGHDDGILAGKTIAWLDSVLADTPPETPVFVCFHHPPVILQAPLVDPIRQHGEDRLAELLTDHPQVVAVLCGHAHMASATTFAGRPLLVAPGVVSTVRLSWEPGDAIDYDLPPMIAFHVLDENRRLTTHYRIVPN